MSLYEAYAAADSAAGWKTETAARLRDFLARKMTPVGQGVESALRSVERALESTVSGAGVRSAMEALRAWLSRRRESGLPDGDQRELERLVQQIVDHCDPSIESYSEYLFTIDLSI